MNSIINKPITMKKCKYRFCGKDYSPTRENNDYCCYAHKVKENNHKQLLERQRMQPQVNLQKSNDRILSRFYKLGTKRIDRLLLLQAGFSFSANSFTLKDDTGGGTVQRYFDYGIKVISTYELEIICFREHLLK